MMSVEQLSTPQASVQKSNEISKVDKLFFIKTEEMHYTITCTGESGECSEFFSDEIYFFTAPSYCTGINSTRLYGRFRVFRRDVCGEIDCSKMLAICCIQSF